METNTITLRTLPAILMLSVILAPIISFLFFSKALQFIIILYLLYWLYRSLILIFGNISGICSYLNWRKNNTIVSLNQATNIKHLIIIPVYKESLEIINATLQNIFKQTYNSSHIYVCVSIEQRAYQDENKLKNLLLSIERFSEQQSEITVWVTIHPSTLSEVQGAAANRTWASKFAIKNFEKLNINLCDILITTMDADTLLDPGYIKTLTQTYLTTPQNKYRYYQPSFYFVNTNFWKAAGFIRVLSTGLTMSVLASSYIFPSSRFTFSCFSMNLSILKKADFWDTNISIDDTPFFWRPYNLLNGNWFSIPLKTAVTVHAVSGKDFLDSCKKQYQQFYRWGWGILSFAIGLNVLLNNIKIPLRKKITKLFQMLDIFILIKMLSISLVLIFLILDIRSVDEIFSNIKMRQTYKIILLINFFLAIATLLCKLVITYNYKNRPSFTKFFVLFLVEMPISLITLVFFGSIPYLHAALDMLRNQPHNVKIKWSNKIINEENNN